MSIDDENSIKRILVALDASPSSLVIIEAAVELASRFQAELIGIYVEDINLLRLSEMPFAREIGHYSASLRSFNNPEVKRQLRAHKRWVHQALARKAGQANIHWSLRVARGIISAELLAAALDADLVILGKAGWSRGRKVGSTAQVIIRDIPQQLLLLQPGLLPCMPILVVYESIINGQKALESAHLLYTKGSGFGVIILADTLEMAEFMHSIALRWLKDHEISAQIFILTSKDVPSLARIVFNHGSGTLVIPAESEKLSASFMLELLNQTACAVLLVR
jgi:nucleotide-binding universal stress UspA family protein